MTGRALALTSEIERRLGHVAAAGRLAADALASVAVGEHVGTCEAHLAAMQLQALLRNRSGSAASRARGTGSGSERPLSEADAADRS